MAAGATGTTSRTFPATMAFQRTWRAYQARVLECLDSYLDDKRLHLAAAPGSGKTILGLEVIRRLDQPTLVLAPTIAVRDRWVETSYGLLSPARRANSIVGLTRLEDPAPLTVTTYQALHAFCADEPDAGSNSKMHQDLHDETDGIDVDNNSSVTQERAIRIPAVPEPVQQGRARAFSRSRLPPRDRADELLEVISDRGEAKIRRISSARFFAFLYKA